MQLLRPAFVLITMLNQQVSSNSHSMSYYDGEQVLRGSSKQSETPKGTIKSKITGKSKGNSNSDDRNGDRSAFVGIDDIEAYERDHKAFIGINPMNGMGSGFVISTITSPDWPQGIPDSNTGRNDLCTCDCAPGPDGIGCVGWGGIAFHYNSMLWKDPKGSGSWEGQMQAYQLVDDGPLNFIGNDIRASPGGEVIYNVACTNNECSGIISGVFRQSNKAVSCAAGIKDKKEKTDTTCSVRCTNAPAYEEWLAYCEADVENKELGFRGYDR